MPTEQEYRLIAAFLTHATMRENALSIINPANAKSSGWYKKYANIFVQPKLCAREEVHLFGLTRHSNSTSGVCVNMFIWPSIALYCLFGIFVFYQQLHAKNFRGANQAFGLVVAASAFSGSITGIVYVGYYAWTVSLWGALVVFALGVVTGIMGLVFERLTGPFALSMLGFVGWPTCAYFMFKALPSGSA